MDLINIIENEIWAINRHLAYPTSSIVGGDAWRESQKREAIYIDRIGTLERAQEKIKKSPDDAPGIYLYLILTE